jgi:hypothetical protein
LPEYIAAAHRLYEDYIASFAKLEKAEGEAKALREALGKIEGLNSCNQDTEDSLLWEIRSIARAALAQGEGEVDHAVS